MSPTQRAIRGCVRFLVYSLAVLLFFAFPNALAAVLGLPL